MNIVDLITNNRDRKLRGLTNNIPLPFRKLDGIIPGIVKSSISIITANSGVGKTQYTKFSYVFNTIDFVESNPNTDLKIFYFPFEESKERFIVSMFSHYLKKYCGISKSVNEILSIGNSVLSKEELKAIQELGPVINRKLKYLDINTDIRNPTGIYKYIRGWLDENGTTTYENKSIGGKLVKVRNKYTPNHEDRYVLVILDHISLLTPESGLSQRDTLGKWSSEYSLDLANMYQCSVINIQQQASDTESVENFKHSKLEPSLAGLANNKETQRDAVFAFGLFMPYRHELPVYRKMNVTQYRDSLVFLSILKNREGESRQHLPLIFDGRSHTYKEL